MMTLLGFFFRRPMLIVGIALAVAVLLFASGCGRKGPLEPPPEEPERAAEQGGY